MKGKYGSNIVNGKKRGVGQGIDPPSWSAGPSSPLQPLSRPASLTIGLVEAAELS